MLGINYLAVVVAAVVAFVGSLVWYILWGQELAKVSKAFAEAQHQRQPWKMLFVLAEHLVIALVVAYLIAHLDLTGFAHAVILGVLLWLGFSATQWVSSIIFEREPLKKAAIHGGDWLLKLVLIAVIVGVWR
jgi:predicted Co/Zn/Cd cation transporter (cation efflux family)